MQMEAVYVKQQDQGFSYWMPGESEDEELDYDIYLVSEADEVERMVREEKQQQAGWVALPHACIFL